MKKRPLDFGLLISLEKLQLLQAAIHLVNKNQSKAVVSYIAVLHSIEDLSVLPW